VIVTPSGAIATVDGPQNCVQALVARMLTGPGELTQHPEYGSTFRELVGGKFSLPIIQGAAANEVRQIVDEDPRFLAGQNITAEPIAGAPTSARVSLELLLTGGDSLTVTDLAGPGVEVTDTPSSLLGTEDLADLADLEAEEAAEDWDFLAQDEAELDDLNDADLTNTFVLPDTTEGD
jgi:hypothetical protein